MDQRALARRTEQAIIRLCYAGLDSRTLQSDVLRRLRRIIPIDAAFCATVDPATLLFTGSLTEEIPASATPAFLANEFLQDDITKFAHLARAPRPVQGLYEATRDDPERSSRFREILAPIGFGDELRAALRVGSATWGVMCLHRDLTGPGFTAAEGALLERLVPHLAVGLRTALLSDRAHTDSGPDGPGLLILAEDLSIAAVTEQAAQWLADVSDWPRRSDPPSPSSPWQPGYWHWSAQPIMQQCRCRGRACRLPPGGGWSSMPPVSPAPPTAGRLR
jgi:GAF domain-containing protein